MSNKVIYTIARILTGLVFTVFGAMKFFPSLMANAPQPTGDALTFMTGIVAAGYFLPLLGLAEVVIGLMLLFNYMPALASVMLVPLSLQIFLYGIYFRQSGYFIGLLPLIFNLYLLYYHWDKYRPMFRK